MIAADFENFVKSQQESAVEAAIDWASMRSEWLQELDSFYKRVLSYLDAFISAGQIRYSFIEIPLTEENLGTYMVRQMDLAIGRQNISLQPVGTLLIGCKGRVDVVGSTGRVQIILVNELAKSARDLFQITVSVSSKKSPPPQPTSSLPVHWAWKIVSNSVNRQFVDMDKETFSAMLMEVANA